MTALVIAAFFFEILIELRDLRYERWRLQEEMAAHFQPAGRGDREVY